MNWQAANNSCMARSEKHATYTHQHTCTDTPIAVEIVWCVFSDDLQVMIVPDE